MHKNYVNYVPMCKKRKSRFYLFHVPKGICKLKTHVHFTTNWLPHRGLEGNVNENT